MAAKRKPKETIVSPVNDTGICPYPRWAGEVGDAMRSVSDVPDPLGFCPREARKRTSGED